ncbi:MAG TPA: response regulator [Burkholderiales bacterium]|nr:response regulator [Burkholderiales bacterium]
MSDLATPVRNLAPQTAFRVLVVDDDPDMAELLAATMEAEGMEPEVVSDGEAAIAAVAAAPPDLVLLDVLLPGTSGFEVCRRLKTDPLTALIPVVLVTALEDRESRLLGIEAGADDFLHKPVRREELMARVKTLRRLHETRRELEAQRLAAEVEHKEALHKALSRYVSPRLTDRIIGAAGGAAPFRTEAERADVVVLFADLRGFSRITETIRVHHVVDMLNEYFWVLTEAAYQHEGTIFNMAGDSLLVGFNVPFAQPDAPARAWRTAMDMVSRFAPVSAEWRTRFGVATGVGIGLCRGEVIIGNIGSPHFMSYTIIGDTVNTAARLMQMAQADEVLVEAALYESIRPLVPAGRTHVREEVVLRGKSEAVGVYSVKL